MYIYYLFELQSVKCHYYGNIFQTLSYTTSAKTSKIYPHFQDVISSSSHITRRSESVSTPRLIQGPILSIETKMTTLNLRVYPQPCPDETALEAQVYLPGILRRKNTSNSIMEIPAWGHNPHRESGKKGVCFPSLFDAPIERQNKQWWRHSLRSSL